MTERAAGVRARVKVAGINRSFLLAALFGGVSYLALRHQDEFTAVVAGSTAALAAAALVLRGIRLAVKDYRLRRDLALALRKTKLHGTARQSTRKERAARGMEDWRSGQLLGLDNEGNPVFRPKEATFSLVEMPPGAGKTSCLVMEEVLHLAMLGYSLIAPDVKEELSSMLASALKAAGIETWTIGIGGNGDVEINLYQRLVDAVHGDAEKRADAVKLASDIASIHVPYKGEDRNSYFVLGSQRAVRVALLYLALFDPQNCTPTGLYLLLTDPARFRAACARLAEFDGADEYAALAEVVRAEAANMMSRAEFNAENYESFLEGASQRLVWANPAGKLGHFGRGAIHDIASARDRQIVIFLKVPLAHLREFSDFVTLANESILAAVKAKPGGHPIHLVGEEFLSWRAPNLVSDLETLRQLRLTASFYVQSFTGLERAYGKEAAAAIAAYADVTLVGALNSHARAKEIEDRLARETVRSQDASFKSEVQDVSLSSRESGKPLETADQLLAMDRRLAWLFVRGLHPTKLQLVHYGEVDPVRDLVEPSPVTGTKLTGRIRVTIPFGELRYGT